MSLAESGNWQVITGEAEFLALKDDWNSLFETNPRHRPFQAWDWVSAWLKHLAGPHVLYVMCWRNKSGELQFILPLIRATGNGRYPSPMLMSICGYGPECSDHTSCLRAPFLDAQIGEIVAESIGLFCGDERIVLGNIDGIDDYPFKLSSILEATGRTFRQRCFEICPVVELGDSWDSFLQRFSSNFRSQTRRYYNRIAKHDTLSFERVDPSASKKFADDLIKLNRNRMGVKGKVSSLEDPAFRDFLMEAIPAMANSGLAWLDVVKDGSHVIGAALNLVHGDCVYYYMGGFDDSATKLRPGTALFACVIMRSIDESFTKYDFLRGTDSYKYRWGGVDQKTYQIDVYPKGLINGRLACALDGCRNGARSLVRKVRMKIRSSV